MATNEINMTEQKKAEKEKRKAKMAKKEKYEKLYNLFRLAIYGEILGLMISGILVIFRLVSSNSISVLIIIIIISGFLEAMFEALASNESYIEKRQEKEKESLVSKLNKKEFKTIKLKEQDNKYFNAFFLNNGISAKIDEDNDDIINVEFCFCDIEGRPHYKVVPFNREYILETIDDVIDSDSN